MAGRDGQLGATRSPPTGAIAHLAVSFLIGTATAAADVAPLPSCPGEPAASPPTLEQTMLESTARALAVFISESRALALAGGVEPIPEAVRRRLADFVPDDILDLVRWTVGEAAELRSYLSMLGAAAVTLDDVVVFADASAAASNAGLWAHELRHVMQYRQCGIAGFARAYVRDYVVLEDDAWDYSRQWHTWSLDQRDPRSASR